MPSDSSTGLFIRQFLLYGKAWQRAGIILALVAAGATLLAFGNLLGILPALLGTVIGLRMWGPPRVRASQFRDRPKNRH